MARPNRRRKATSEGDIEMNECFMIHFLVTLFSVAFALVMGFSFGRLIGRLESKEQTNDR